MSTELLSILQNPDVAERVSPATRAVLEDRAHPAAYTPFFNDKQRALLQMVVSTILPQDLLHTNVDIAEGIDRRLAAGINAGWRFAVLPEDGEAYREGLTALAKMLEATPMQAFDRMPQAARESYLRCVLNGDVDSASRFPLSKFMRMVRTDVVRVWMAHPATMQRLELYGFADGFTGRTDGPTANEGWVQLTPDTALPFEHTGRQL